MDFVGHSPVKLFAWFLEMHGQYQEGGKQDSLCRYLHHMLNILASTSSNSASKIWKLKNRILGFEQ